MHNNKTWFGLWVNGPFNIFTTLWHLDRFDRFISHSRIPILLFLFSSSLPHLLPGYIPEQNNPPPFNYSDPALHYITHSSPRILDNITPRQRLR